MKLKHLLGSIPALLAATTPAFAWDNIAAHPNLTNRAVDLLISLKPQYAYLNTYAKFNLNTKPQLTCLDEGAVKEDYGLSPDWNTSVWGSQQDAAVPALSWKSHGYNPKTGEVWYDTPDVASNLYVYGSTTVWNDVLTKGNRYFQLGRFCHLIEDMTAPPHVHADFHGTGDDVEAFSKSNFSTVPYTPTTLRKPSTDGLAPVAGLPHPADLRTNTPGNFIRNAAWKTYYMTSYYGGSLVLKEGNYQPDSELKRMFPYAEGGLRYDDGGWFTNDAWIINAVGWNWIGYGIGNNPDWWECPGDARYFYLENIDGKVDSNAPSGAGTGIAPKVFKKDRFRRVLPTDNLGTVLTANTKIMSRIYCESLYPLAAEWVAGFIDFVEAR